MATGNVKTQCFTCTNTRTFSCEGCSNNYCRLCLPKHLQELDTDLEQIELDHNQFREKLDRQKRNPSEHALINEIDQWEQGSINKIRQAAKEYKDKIVHFTNNKYFVEIEKKLNDIATKLKGIRQQSEFNEIDLNQLKQNLNQLKQELEKPSTIKIRQDASSLVQKMSIVLGKFILIVQSNMRMT